MARLSKEEKIRELETRLAHYEKLLTESEDRENRLLQAMDRGFEDSPLYRLMQREIDYLRAWKESHESDADKLDIIRSKLNMAQHENHELRLKQGHNARGAGRKANDEKMLQQLERFKELHDKKLPAKVIQDEMQISQATYYRYLSRCPKKSEGRNTEVK